MKTLYSKLFFLLLLALAPQAFAQGFGFSGSPVVNGMGQPIAGASVAISTVNPCGTSPTYTSCGGQAQGSYTGSTPPASLATLYTDITVGTTKTNPLTTDPFGNWTAYVGGAANYWVTVYGTRIKSQVFFAGSAGAGANAIQGIPVTGPITLIPGVSLVVDSTGTSFVSLTPYDIDTRFCGLPVDGTTDSYATLQACVDAHPGAHFRFWKTSVAALACDYTFTQSIFTFGAGQWFDGNGDGPNASQRVRLCFPRGVSGFIGTNQMSPSWKVSNLYITGGEAFSRTTASTFLAPFGYGYPSIVWQTVSTTASSVNITSNGTNEAWTNQTDLATIQILGAGAPSGTVSIATTINNFTATCSCTPAMIGKTVAIGAAGPAGGTLYAHIIGLTGTVAAGMTGNAYLDQKPAASVGAAVSNLSFDYYGTISSHSSTSAAIVSPAVTTAVSNAYAYVGSTADAIRNVANFSKFQNLTIQNFGRHGINTANETYPYIQTGGASNLADNVVIDSVIIQLVRGSGIYCQGGDCNLVQTSNSTISQNQYWGIHDKGFLGNTHSTHNTAGNHNDCTILPCPSIGGASGGATNTTATWYDGLPYASATAPPILVTDGTCTNASNVVTTAATGKFVTGQADAVNGQVVLLTGCGTAGADLLTFITGFTNANSITVNDNATCGGGCPATTGQIQVYSSATTTSGTAFSSGMVGKTIILLGGGPDGQALVTTMAQFYSTTKVGLNAAPKNRSIGTSSVYFGTSSYAQEANWAKAWDFSTGNITTGTTALTLTGANDLFISTMCSAATNPAAQVPITIVGAGPGGTDHVTVCTAFTNSHAITLADPVSLTVSGGEVRVGQDGGTYGITGTSAPSTCINCYGEVDEKLHPRKFGPLVSSTPGILEAAPAVTGIGNWSPVSSVTQNGRQLPTSFFNFKDSGGLIYFGTGRNRNQQLDLILCDVASLPGCTTNRIWRQTTTSAGIYQLYVNESQVFGFTPGALRDFLGDPAVTSGLAFRFKGNSGLQNVFGMNADGSYVFGCTTGSSNCTTISTKPNTAARAIVAPDAAGTLCVTGSGNNPCQFKRSAGCATAASLAATCTTTLTWTTAFADTNYTPNCTGQLVTSGVPLNGGITAKSASAIDFQTVAGTAAAAQYTNISCSATHD